MKIGSIRLKRRSIAKDQRRRAAILHVKVDFVPGMVIGISFHLRHHHRFNGPDTETIAALDVANRRSPSIASTLCAEITMSALDRSWIGSIH
jgi:hypothetical protein